MNWHGKALGKESANALKAIKENIANQGPHGLKPGTVVNDAPVVNIRNVQLSEPPSYQKGQMVRFENNLVIFMVIFKECKLFVLSVTTMLTVLL